MTPHRYRLIITHSGRSVEVTPTKNGEWTPETLYDGIGRMIMAKDIDAITVFRDGRPYRHVKIDGYGAPITNGSGGAA